MQRHMKKMDAELTKFKWELEADHPGITEVLEERELSSSFIFIIMSLNLCFFPHAEVRTCHAVTV